MQPKLARDDNEISGLIMEDKGPSKPLLLVKNRAITIIITFQETLQLFWAYVKLITTQKQVFLHY